VQKYLDHLPLTRQVDIMEREGLLISSQTLWDYLDRLVRLLAPAHEALHAYVLSQPIIGADETRWRMMGWHGEKGEATWWQAWAVGTQDAVSYRILDSRSSEAATWVLGSFNGVLMVDGYIVYKSLAGKGGGFILVHCWTHARRKFFDIRDSYPQVEEVLDLIGELYAVERSCPPGAEGDALRLALRQTRSREIISRIHAWALAQRVLPTSGLGKAIKYLNGVWNGLMRFLEDPRIPLDNNALERAQRGLVVGRKNHYGSHSQRGAEVAALFYSLMESAKLVGLEPKQYLRLAVSAALKGEPIPLPHQLVAEAAKPSA
jgi:transposase